MNTNAKMSYHFHGYYVNWFCCIELDSEWLDFFEQELSQRLTRLAGEKDQLNLQLQTQQNIPLCEYNCYVCEREKVHMCRLYCVVIVIGFVDNMLMQKERDW